jgi:hypothetical protein
MNSRQAKEIMIADYLYGQNIQSAKEQGDNYWYCSPLRKENSPSFKVNNRFNVWYDHGIGKGGNILDLVMLLNGIETISDALRHLSSSRPVTHTDYFSFQQQKFCSEISRLDAKPLFNPVLMEYLKIRQINLDIAKAYCHDIYYLVRDKWYFSVGFKNDAGGYELRNKYFKGSSSPKDITTIRNGKESCLVFEGFTDYLSYLTLKDIEKPQHDVVVLNSVMNLSKAKGFITGHEQVYTFLDNDEAGKRTTSELKLLCRNLSDQSDAYSRHKDLNDYLCKKYLPEQEEKKKAFKLKR